MAALILVVAWFVFAALALLIAGGVDSARGAS